MLKLQKEVGSQGWDLRFQRTNRKWVTLISEKSHSVRLWNRVAFLIIILVFLACSLFSFHKTPAAQEGGYHGDPKNAGNHTQRQPHRDFIKIHDDHFGSNKRQHGR